MEPIGSGETTIDSSVQTAGEGPANSADTEPDSDGFTEAWKNDPDHPLRETASWCWRRFPGGTIFAVTLVVCGLVYLCVKYPNTTAASPRGGSTDHATTFEMCKKFVSEELKSPSGATWRDPLGDQVTYSDNGGAVTVNASVDSDNSFGAHLRSTYTCTVTNTSGDTWHLDNINVVDGGAS